VPLGILRANDIKFTPDLPKSKQEAIQRIGIGLLDKLYLEFDKCFWNPKMDWLGYISEDWPLTLNCTKYKPEKPLLCLFNSGRSCVKFSEMSDEEVV
jgi:monoamine oxidase